MDIEKIKRKIDMKQGALDELRSIRMACKKGIKRYKKEYSNATQAIVIAQDVAQKTQQALEVKISNIVTPALKAIFRKDYRLQLVFNTKRNKTEADIFLVDSKGNEYDLIGDNGGGIADVTAFTLRMACWKLRSPKVSPIFIMDEPLKFVSEKYIQRSAEFISQLCKQLDVQIIAVTHVDEFIEYADNNISLSK